ncbi:MAG: hypothetical protein EP332_14555 [Bacteroidetes bacterium]|nr:MAG: hypothetical protein EP332_14555 [Bacteroidota bacterium]
MNIRKAMYFGLLASLVSCDGNEAQVKELKPIELEKQVDAGGMNHHELVAIKDLIRALDEPVLMRSDYDSIFSYYSLRPFDSTYCLSLRYKDGAVYSYTKVFRPTETTEYPNFSDPNKDQRQAEFSWRYTTTVGFPTPDRAKPFLSLFDSFDADKVDCFDCAVSYFIVSSGNQVRIKRRQSNQKLEDSLTAWLLKLNQSRP